MYKFRELEEILNRITWRVDRETNAKRYHWRRDPDVSPSEFFEELKASLQETQEQASREVESERGERKTRPAKKRADVLRKIIREQVDEARQTLENLENNLGEKFGSTAPTRGRRRSRRDRRGRG